MDALYPKDFDLARENASDRPEAEHAREDISAAFRPLAECLVEIAGATPGKFVIAAYGNDPQTGARIAQVRHVTNSHGAAELVVITAASLAGTPGANVYILPALMRADLPDGKKGGILDVVGVLAAVLDYDRHSGPEIDYASKLPLQPHFVVETSPGNFQLWLLFDALQTPADVQPILDAFVAETGADPTGAEPSHVFRVPGGWNWPNEAKIREGRPAEPVLAKVIVSAPWEPAFTVQALRELTEQNWPGAFARLHERRQAGEEFVKRAQKVPVPEETLIEVLGFISPECDRKTWIRVIGGIRATRLRDVPEAETDLRLLDIAIAWSCGDYDREKRGVPGNYVDEYDVEAAFWSLPPKPGGTTYGTLDAIARQNGYDKAPPRAPLEETFRQAIKLLGENEVDPELVASEALRLNRKTPWVSAEHFLQQLYTDPDKGRRLIHYRDDFYAWTGTHYRAVSDAQLRSQIYPFLHAAFDGRKPFAPNVTKVNEILHALKAHAFLSPQVETPTWLPPVTRDLHEPHEILACKNGLLHLPTLLVAPHTPQLLVFNALDFDYEREASEPVEWLQFLHSLWPDDSEAIATLQEMFGYFLSGDLRQQKLFLLVGPKRAGKGTIARLLRMLLGAENVSGPTLSSLGQPFGLEPLIGKRAAIVSDARLGGGADQNAIVERLLSISGEDAIQVPRKFKSAWEGKLGVRFFILSNELPRFTDASAAIASRFHILTLSNSFYGREDQRLTDRLMGELPGILNWAITGWQRLTNRGHFVTPKSSQASTQALEQLSSPIKAFITERCVIEPSGQVEKQKLFDCWVSWCHQNGHLSGSSIAFGVRLSAALPGLRDIRPRVRGKPVRMYAGIAIRSENYGY